MDREVVASMSEQSLNEQVAVREDGELVSESVTPEPERHEVMRLFVPVKPQMAGQQDMGLES
jgi:hypothetical protein